MKKPLELLLLCTLLFSPSFAQNPYTAVLRLGVMDTVTNPDEWAVLVLGRQVANLANGYREVGYHSTTWNASAQASGVYFARFNVTNAEGRVTYSKVNKLVLMK